MSDRQQDHNRADHDAGRDSDQATGASSPATGTPFRLIADFVVETETATKFLQKPNLTPEQRRLFLILLTNPEARDRFSRLAIVSDFEAYMDGRYFEGVFSGPDETEMLNCILPYLTADLKKYWTRLREDNYQTFATAMEDIFCEFRSSLKRTVIEDRTTSEEIPLRITNYPHLNNDDDWLTKLLAPTEEK